MKKILVVDDDAGILDAITLILEESGYRVTALSNGEKTLELVHALQPDVILLDIYISGTDGRDICKLLKQQAATQHIPVIMVAARLHGEKEAAEAGADDFLSKPFEITDLLEKVAKYSE